MAFNKRVLGRHGQHLLSDDWGYVPQIGDHPRNFCWPKGVRHSRREWNTIIWKCERETRQALRKMNKEKRYGKR